MKMFYYALKRLWIIIKPFSIKWKKLHPDAIKPTRAYSDDAAFDLYAVEDLILPPDAHTNCGCGVAVMVPSGWSYDLRGRSSLNRNGIITALGLCDSYYTGELRAVLSNLSGKEYIIKKGERIGQIKFNPVWDFPWEEVEKFEAPEGTRGGAGFGSSGR
jgi:dUTP pyrophosphatase